MNIVLLSGGSGKRLWPLSNEIRSKQFVRFLKNESGGLDSMIQRVYKQIRDTDEKAEVIVATSMAQQSIINRQLNNEVSISIEPCRRDTFPAIVLASSYLVNVLKKNRDDAVVFCPVDPYVDNSFFKKIKFLYDYIPTSKANVILIGIEPSFPSDKYGYIIPRDDCQISDVVEFKEKPNTDEARKYIKKGALWNGGVFGFKLDYILKKSEEILGTSDYKKLLSNYESIQKISFDYAIVEKEKRIEVIRYSGVWRDIGTWDSLTEVMDDNIIGRGTIDDACSNVHIVNEIDLPIVALGLKDIVIAASPDGILISNKERSKVLKNYVDNIDQRPMFEERFWGNYKVLDYNISNNNKSLTRHIIINANKYISYQRHIHRFELWTIIEGMGYIVINGHSKKVTRGDFIAIKPNDLHAIKAIEDLHIIEVQIGEELLEDDIERFDFDWNSIKL